MDDFDLKLLNALQEDGRLTNLELAGRIGLSASQCSRRRTALEQSGVIEGYHAALANQAVGLDVLVFIQVGLATQSPDSAQAFAKLIRALWRDHHQADLNKGPGSRARHGSPR